MFDTPAYGMAEASRYIKLPPATLRSWVIGRSYPRLNGKGYFEPLIPLPDPERNYLSFGNLIEAFVLRALRQDYRVPVESVRKAKAFAERKLGISRLLLHQGLQTTAGDLFLRKYGELINLSRSGQMAMRKILQDYLTRIDWDRKMPARFFPYFDRDKERFIAIDPEIKFGRPVIISKGVSTEVIADRIDAGEQPELLAEDYGLKTTEIEMAILFERAA